MAENTANTTDRPRSVSRGRDAFQSSGRGGAGNIRRSSQEPSAPAPEPQVPYIVRGRERQPASSSERATSTGRGGVGNIRSTSQSRSLNRAPEIQPQSETITEEVVDGPVPELKKDEPNAKPVHSSGRGGLGNINRTKSKSRDPGNERDKDHAASAQVHSTGRGGRGNIVPDGPSAPETDGSTVQA